MDNVSFKAAQQGVAQSMETLLLTVKKCVPGINRSLLAVFLFGLAANYGGLMTNDFTPMGDGSRIMPYVEFADAAESFYPLWNPYKLGGVPVLSTPERYVWVAKLIDSTSEYRNFQLNLIFMVEVLLLCLVLYLTARELDLSREAAWVLMIIVSNSWYLKKFVFSGRINGLLAFILINTAFLLYIKYLKKRKASFFFLSSLILGYLICVLAHYLFVMLYPFFLCVGVYYNRLNNSPGKAMAVTVMESVAMSLAGMTLWAVLFLPEFKYLIGNHINFNPVTSLQDWLPPQITLLNIVVPVFYGAVGVHEDLLYPFVSICSFPLVMLLVLNHRQYPNKTFYCFGGVVLFSLLIFMGNVYPLDHLLELVSSNFIFKNIRENAGIQYGLTISLAFVSAYGFDSIRTVSIKRYYHRVVPVAGLLLLLCLSIILDRLYCVASPAGKFAGMSVVDLLNNHLTLGLQVKFLVLAVLLVLPCTVPCNERSVKNGIVLLFILQILFFNVQTNSAVLTNQTGYPAIADHLAKDSSYFRVWTGRFHYAAPTELGMTHIPVLNGDSKYFSKEHRHALETLFNKKIDELRPNWIKKIPEYHGWNPGMVKLLNLKYLVTPPWYAKHPLLQKEWTPVVLDQSEHLGGGKIDQTRQTFLDKPSNKATTYRRLLWEKKGWRSSLQVFDEWEVIRNPRAILAGLRQESFRPFERVYLEKDPLISMSGTGREHRFDVRLTDYKEDRLNLSVRTNKNGILFVPEYFDDGWIARVDGKKTEIIRADLSFRAIPVSAGEHQVVLEYLPSMVYIGALVSLVTFIAAVLLLNRDPGLKMIQRMFYKKAE